MKVRLHKQSIRIRLTQGEVQTLSEGGALQFCLQLGLSSGDGWQLALVAAAGVRTIGAIYQPDTATLRVVLPLSQAQALAQTDLVTLEASLPTPLKLVIEKDFQCLKPRPGDDDHDTFQHPAEGVAKC